MPAGPTASDALLGALLSWQNGSALVIAPGTIITTVPVQGDGAPFLRAFAECDEQITKAILTQTLATEEGSHQARAAAQVHQDVLDTLVRQGKQAVCSILTRDILTPWTMINYGDTAADLVPVPSLGTTERHDLPAVMAAVAQLQRAGYLHESQYPASDRLLGLPVRDLTRER